MKDTLRVIISGGQPEALARVDYLCRRGNVMVAGICSSLQETLSAMNQLSPDAVFIHDTLPDGPALSLVRYAKEHGYPASCVIIGAAPEDAYQAFQLNAADLLPLSADESRFAQAVRRAALLKGAGSRHVFVRTFGYFDVFVEGEALPFTNAKAKELLAILVDNEGGVVSMDRIIDRLWSERPYDENVKQLYRKAVQYLNRLMESENLHFFTSGRGWCRINPTAVNCDLFDVLEKKPHALDLYHGQYMFAYSWGEERTVQLDELADSVPEGSGNEAERENGKETGRKG